MEPYNKHIRKYGKPTFHARNYYNFVKEFKKTKMYPYFAEQEKIHKM